MKLNCSYCGKENDFKTGAINAARKRGQLVQYCNKTCAGLGRRRNLTIEQKKAEKANYDREYRNNNRELLKEKKQIYYQTPSGRAVQKRNRDNRKEQHKAYIKTDRYRKWKHDYDKIYVAKNKYGEFFESGILLNELEIAILPERKEAKIQNGISNKSQKRKRLWNSMQRTLNKHFGIPSMG